MAFGLLTVGSGYGQFGFVGSNGIILADASTLTVNVSGATSQTIVSPCVAGMVNSNTLLGISSPNTGGGNAFGFMFQNGAFSTFALPSSFVDTDGTYTFSLFNQLGNITDLWIAAQSPSDNGSYPYLMNLSVIAGLTTGTDIVDTVNSGTYYWTKTNNIGYVASGDLLTCIPSAEAVLLNYNINTSTFTANNMSYISRSATVALSFGADIAFNDDNNNIVLINASSGGVVSAILASSFSSIATATPLIYNYLGTLMYVNPALNLACSMNLTTGYISPIFPFAINPPAGGVGYNSFDQSTGIMYLNVGGSQPNMFGNLTPMLLT